MESKFLQGEVIMRRMRKSLLAFVALTLVMPSNVMMAATNESKGEDAETGKVSSKDEVVYANLSATGQRQEIYVVNILDVEQAGEVVDYGKYSNIKNLTNLSPMEHNDNEVQVEAQKGKFYYQGNINEADLPWNISITYLLDGKEMTPQEIAGKEGHVQIQIATTANDEVDQIFFQNYLLQIAVPLSEEIYSNITAPNGMLANAGKNKQVTFTVMPEKEETFFIEADAKGFELEGIDISAVPSSMAIDTPDIDEMMGDMNSLTDAISKVNQGVGELESGVTALNDGVKSMRNGSSAYKDGVQKLASSSGDLVSASKQIEQALETISHSLKNNPEEISLGDLNKLPEGLGQISAGLKETSKGLVTLTENYAKSYDALNKAIESIPEYEISEEEIQELYGSNADQQVLNQLLETYEAARIAKGTYNTVKEAFIAVDTTLKQVSAALLEMANNLDAMANGLSSSLEGADMAKSFAQLQEGISQLSSNYQAFHSGLVSYTGGVKELSNSYGQLDSGMAELSNGTGELATGVNQLHDGTSELENSTNDLPEEMRKEVDKMISEFDKSDFEPISFVSKENKHVHAVQFVFKTESIKYEEQEKVEEKEKEVTGFWNRLMELFK